MAGGETLADHLVSFRWHPKGCGLWFCARPGMLIFVFATVAMLALRGKRMVRGSALNLWAGTLLPRLLFPRPLRSCTVCGDRNSRAHSLHRLKAVKWHTLQAAAAQEPNPSAILNVLLAADAPRWYPLEEWVANVRQMGGAAELIYWQFGSTPIVELREGLACWAKGPGASRGPHGGLMGASWGASRGPLGGLSGAS